MVAEIYSLFFMFSWISSEW